jgi:hypothetical protein
MQQLAEGCRTGAMQSGTDGHLDGFHVDRAAVASLGKDFDPRLRTAPVHFRARKGQRKGSPCIATQFLRIRSGWRKWEKRLQKVRLDV